MADRKRVQFRFWLSPLTIDQGLFMRSNEPSRLNYSPQ